MLFHTQGLHLLIDPAADACGLDRPFSHLVFVQPVLLRLRRRVISGEHCRVEQEARFSLCITRRVLVRLLHCLNDLKALENVRRKWILLVSVFLIVTIRYQPRPCCVSICFLNFLLSLSVFVLAARVLRPEQRLAFHWLIQVVLLMPIHEAAPDVHDPLLHFYLYSIK